MHRRLASMSLGRFLSCDLVCVSVFGFFLLLFYIFITFFSIHTHTRSHWHTHTHARTHTQRLSNERLKTRGLNSVQKKRVVSQSIGKKLLKISRQIHIYINKQIYKNTYIFVLYKIEFSMIFMPRPCGRMTESKTAVGGQIEYDRNLKGGREMKLLSSCT